MVRVLKPAESDRARARRYESQKYKGSDEAGGMRRSIPDNPLFDLLPPSRDDAIIGRLRLRSAHLLPVLRTRTRPRRLEVPIIYTSRFDPLPAKVTRTHQEMR